MKALGVDILTGIGTIVVGHLHLSCGCLKIRYFAIRISCLLQEVLFTSSCPGIRPHFSIAILSYQQIMLG
jgi:hypothetical protein